MGNFIRIAFAVIILQSLPLCACQKQAQIKLETSDKLNIRSTQGLNFKLTKNSFLNFAKTGTNMFTIAFSEIHLPMQIKIPETNSDATIKVPTKISNDDASECWSCNADTLSFSLEKIDFWQRNYLPKETYFKLELDGQIEIFCIRIVDDFEIKTKSCNDKVEVATINQETVISKTFLVTNHKTTKAQLEINVDLQKIPNVEIDALSTKEVSVILDRGKTIEAKTGYGVFFTCKGDKPQKKKAYLNIMPMSSTILTVLSGMLILPAQAQRSCIWTNRWIHRK